MKLEVVEINEKNMMEVLTADDVYVIRPRMMRDEFVMEPIGEANVADVVSANVAIVRLSK